MLHNYPSSALSNIWSTWKDKERKGQKKFTIQVMRLKALRSTISPWETTNAIYTEPEEGFQLRTTPWDMLKGERLTAAAVIPRGTVKVVAVDILRSQEEPLNPRRVSMATRKIWWSLHWNKQTNQTKTKQKQTNKQTKGVGRCCLFTVSSSTASAKCTFSVDGPQLSILMPVVD